MFGDAASLRFLPTPSSTACFPKRSAFVTLFFRRWVALSPRCSSLSWAAPQPGVPPGEIDTAFEIAADDGKRDDVRHAAIRELALSKAPKDRVLPKLYALFQKKWQIRLDAARYILRDTTLRDVPDFLRHLPSDASTKIALSEPVTYGAIIMVMATTDDCQSPRPVLAPFLRGDNLGAKLTAIGSYYLAKRAEGAELAAIEDDPTPVPKCDPGDGCGWSCDVALPGSKDVEHKTITTVGEFVRWCVEPSLQ